MTNEELTMSNEEAKEIIINEIQQWKANPNLTVGEPLYIALYTAIKALEQQTNKGKWIRSWCEWQQYLECSECGYETGLRCDTNYCPNCGARMTESEGENDEL